MTVAQNQFPQRPQLKDLLDMATRQAALNLNCHAVGTIEEFDETTQTASVTINYKKTINEPNPITGVYAQKLVDYPVIVDAPVVVIGGGGFALTAPIDKGDECIVIFNDRDLDNWFATGATGAAVDTARLHSFSDAMVLVGVRSLPHVVLAYETDGISLRNRLGTVKVKVTDAGVLIQESSTSKIEVTSTSAKVTIGTATVEFKSDKTVFTFAGGTTFEIDSSGKWAFSNATGGDFMTALITLFTDVQAATAGGFPLVMPTFTADLAKLQTFKP